MSEPVPDLLIVSGGSEVVGLAVAAAAHAAGIAYAVFSLAPRSVLRGAPGCLAWVDLSPHTSREGLRDRFLKALAALPRTPATRLAILPTEDSSLRLLNECVDEILPLAEFPRARALRMGGADKAEVIELAAREGITEGLARSLIVDDYNAAAAAMDMFGSDAVFKPSLKPLDMNLSGLGERGTKVVTQQHDGESPEGVLRRLRDAWPISERWIAQPRLRTGVSLERSVCAVRGAVVRACQVVERAKYPRMGGTAYWVSIDPRNDLVGPASRLLEALDVVGVCELSYLPDTAGIGHLIELNPRPWLQVGLVERAGFSIIADTVSALRGSPLAPDAPVLTQHDWLQPERMVMALLSGQGSPRELGQLVSLLLHRRVVIGGYSSKFPKVRRRLMMRALRGALGIR